MTTILVQEVSITSVFSERGEISTNYQSREGSLLRMLDEKLCFLGGI